MRHGVSKAAAGDAVGSINDGVRRVLEVGADEDKRANFVMKKGMACGIHELAKQ
jgi:hypothetical protein